jgi:glycosyltransferase involved in cell wall biosynthesis
MTDGRLGLVSIGMPVYNGGRYIRRAIEALLAQTYSDFELIISDNGSEDATQTICLEYAARDPRVRYSRNERNIGASQNFNKVFHLARGRYFKWAAHDDWIAPEFLASCVECLENHPQAVLCWTGTVFVDEAETRIPQQPLKADPLSLTEAAPLRLRFRQALRVHPGPPLFGLIRPELLKKTGLMRGTVGSDRVLLAELSLLGAFCWLPQPLLFYTHYPKARVGYYSTDWWDPSRQSSQLVRAALVQARQCASLVARAGLGPARATALMGSIAAKYGPLTLRRLGWRFRGLVWNGWRGNG